MPGPGPVGYGIIKGPKGDSGVFNVQETSTNQNYYPVFTDNSGESVVPYIDGGNELTYNPSTNFLSLSGSINLTSGGYYYGGSSSPLSLEISRSVPTTIDNYVEIGTFFVTNGAHNIHLSVTVPSASFSVSKQYIISANYHGTSNTWKILSPVDDPGPYVGNDFQVDININANYLYLRLRRTSGSTAGTAYIRVESTGYTSDAFTPTAATGSATAPTALYNPLYVTNANSGRVGINTISPSADLEIYGATSNKIKLTTSNAPTTYYSEIVNAYDSSSAFYLAHRGHKFLLSSSDANSHVRLGNLTTNIYVEVSSLNGYIRNLIGGNMQTHLNTTGLGIGVSPTAKLDVNGSTRLRGILYDYNNEAGTSGQILSSTGAGVDWIDAPATVGVTSDNTNATYYPVFTTAAGGSNTLYVDDTTGPLSYNPYYGTLDVNGQINFNDTTWASTRAIFGQPRAKISELNNVLWQAHQRYTVTGLSSPSLVFNGNYDSGLGLPTSTTNVININLTPIYGANGLVYPHGYIVLSFYFTSYNYDSLSARFKDKDNVWRNALSITDISTVSGYKVIQIEVPSNSYLTDIEITIVTNTGSCILTGMEYYCNRHSGYEPPYLDKTQSSHNIYGAMVLRPTGTTITPLSIRQYSGQTAALQTWTNSAGTVLSTVDANGNFGIQTSTPSEALHVVGDILATGSGSTIGLSSIANAAIRVGTSFGIDDNEAVFSNASEVYYGNINSAGDVIMRFGGVNGITMDASSQHVGIGSLASIPDSRLHVAAGSAGTVTSLSNSIATFEHSTNAYVSILTPDSNERGILFGEPTSNIAGGIIYNNSGTPDGLQFRVNGNSTRMTIASDGDVGIGPTVMIPDAKLHIVTNQNSTNQFTDSFVKLSPVQTTDNTGFTGIAYGISTLDDYGWSVGGLRTSIDANVGAFVWNWHLNTSSGTELMRLEQDGKLGIGTNDPSFLVHAVSSVNTNTQMNVQTTSTGSAAIAILSALNSTGGGLQVGKLGTGYTATTGYGAAGDSFIYSSTTGGGNLNIINNYSGNINLYAGSGADASDPEFKVAPGAVSIGYSTTETGVTLSNYSYGKHYASSTIRHYKDVAAYNYGRSIVGTLKITLPKYASITMMTIKILGFNYDSQDGGGSDVGGRWEVTLGGYNYNAPVSWYHYGATCSGALPFTSIRYGNDGVNNIILLGTTTTAWSYPKVVITDVMTGHGTYTGWGTGWSMSMITDETGFINNGTVNNYFQAPKGIVNRPGLIFGGDIDSGIYMPSAGNLGISTVGNERVRIASDGKVGIGSDNPTSKLHIETGDTSGDAVLNLNDRITVTGDGVLKFGSAAANGYLSWGTGRALVGGLTGNHLSLMANGSEQVRIDTSGNVGIGTTTADSRLHAMLGSAGTVTAWNNSVATFENSTHAYISLLTPDASERGILFGEASSSTAGSIIYNASSTLDGFQFRVNGGNTKMVIDSTGNVGIGTSAPSQTLHVSGNARVTGALYDGANGTGASGQILSSTGSATVWTNIAPVANLLFREDNRTISPSELTAGYLKFGFTSWDNNNTSPYADFLHMRSYTDSSGGSDNLLMFKKTGLGMRLWQQTYGSATPYSSYVDFWHTGNDGATSGLDADLLDGQEGTYYLDLANHTGTLSVSNGGTGATSYTAGAVLFGNGTSPIAIDASNLFWDDANNELGIGTNNPSSTVHIDNGYLTIEAGASNINGFRVASDGIGGFLCYSVTTNAHADGWGWVFKDNVPNTPSGNFHHRLGYGSNSYINGIGGNLGVGTKTPNTKLEVTATSDTVSSLRLNKTATGNTISDIQFGVAGAGVKSGISGSSSDLIFSSGWTYSNGSGIIHNTNASGFWIGPTYAFWMQCNNGTSFDLQDYIWTGNIALNEIFWNQGVQSSSNRNRMSKLLISTTSDTYPTYNLDIPTGSVRIGGALYDVNESTGTSGQVLSSTGTGVDWIDVSAALMDVTSTNAAAIYYPVFTTTAGTGNTLYVDDTTIPLTYNPSTNHLTVASLKVGPWIGGSTYHGLQHSAQTGSEYMIISNDTDTFISATTGYGVYIRGGNNSTTHQIYVSSGSRATASGSPILTQADEGHGNGIDSDTLDGQHGSFYQNGSNINAGTVSANYLPKQEAGISIIGNFGQWESHTAYTNFNTEPSYWGWTFVGGNTNAPHTSSSQWYRNKVGLGSGYGKGFSAGDYSLEMAAPRYNLATRGAELYFRTTENGTASSWYQVGAKIDGYTTWHAGNDGPSSTLNADLLDDQEGSYYLNLANHTGILSVSNGGTGASSFTSGAVLLGNGTSAIKTDATQLFWDDTNNRLGVGTNAPATTLHVNGSVRGNSAGALRIDTGSGYLDAGPQDTSWCHFNTDRARFYFDKGITANTGLIGSYDEDLALQTSGVTRLTISTTTGEVVVNTASSGYTLVCNGSFFADNGYFDGNVDVDTLSAIGEIQGNNIIGKDAGTQTDSSKLVAYVNSINTEASTNLLTIEQDGTGDAMMSFLLTGVKRWVAGIDNSDSDAFIIKDTSIGATSLRLSSSLGLIRFGESTINPTISDIPDGMGCAWYNTSTPKLSYFINDSGTIRELTGGGGTNGVNILDSTANQEMLILFNDGVGNDITDIYADNTAGALRYNPSTEKLTVGGDCAVGGALTATTKSFKIKHPSKEGHILEYGSLESPYHGVRLTGRGKMYETLGKVVLPEYLKDLIHDDESINIQITNIRHGKVLWVEYINLEENCFVVGCETPGDWEFFWTLTGVRKDIDKLEVEYSGC